MAQLISYNRGIKGLAMATWNSENSYGAMYPITGARAANLQWVVESDELRGDDVVLDRYTTLVSATLTINEASIDLNTLDMWLGGTLVSNANYYDLKVADTDTVPYIAITGHIVGSGGVGDLHFFLPKAKLAGNLQLNAQVDSYLIPQADFQGVQEGPINGMLRLRHYNITHVLAIPLATS
jgi:hypothetical protein